MKKRVHSIAFAIDIAVILLIPFISAPASYGIAVLVVVSLLFGAIDARRRAAGTSAPPCDR